MSADGVLRMEGALTQAHAVRLLNSGIAAIDGGVDEFDFSDVAEIDSSALALIFAWMRAARARDKSLRFSHLPGNLSSLAEVYGVGDLLAPQFA